MATRVTKQIIKITSWQKTALFLKMKHRNSLPNPNSIIGTSVKTVTCQECQRKDVPVLLLPKFCLQDRSSNMSWIFMHDNGLRFKFKILVSHMDIFRSSKVA